MSGFFIYLQLGFQHIADLAGYDHILFVVTLCAVYSVKQIKQLAILVTAFTIGHSVTLALATLKIVSFSVNVIELLIPITILITAVANIIWNKDTVGLHRFKYAIAMFFGLIHGLGFSNYLRMLLGLESDIVLPLFAFNLGLEIGQFLIVFIILLLSVLFINLLKQPKREWSLVVSGAGLGVSLILIVERVVLIIHN